MSYDLNVWMRSDADLDRVCEALELTNVKGGYGRSTRSWNVSACVDPVEDEDIPSDVFPRLGGIRFLVSLTLEPIDAVKPAHSFVRKLAREIAEAGVGVIEDPQTGDIRLSKSARATLGATDTLPEPPNRPSFLGRLLRPKLTKREEPRVSELQLSWWVDHTRLFEQDGIERFVAAVERYLPEALPRRYGPHEPPNLKYAETGRDAFVTFLAGEEMCVIYPSRPCTGAQYPVGQVEIGWTGQGNARFRAGLVEIGFDASVLNHPNWRIRLPQAWRALSKVVQPFYGEARVLGGRIAGRATLFHDHKSEDHPVLGPWWRGIPSRPACARVLGTAYAQHWPVPETEDALAFLESTDWRRPDGLVNAVPAAVAQPEGDVKTARADLTAHASYPQVFPF